MGEHSKIQWTHHTFDPWRGCTKVSPGCANCYAERLSHRNPAVLGEWGDAGKRVIASESMWREPLKWAARAEALGERHRVFCASLADVFEDRPELVAPRARLWELIWKTRHSLDWLLLTKRPENAARLWFDAYYETFNGTDSHGNDWQCNVWLGTSVENQQAADERIPHLLQVPAAVRFLSCEPLLGPLDLITPKTWYGGDGKPLYPCTESALFSLDWVICGGESGPNARPMHPAWARSLRDQCQAARVPFFFKQWGEYGLYRSSPQSPCQAVYLDGRHCEFNRDAMLYLERTSGKQHDGTGHSMYRVGVEAAGRLLDGVEHSEFPREVRTA